MEKKEQGTVQALERGLKILELLMHEKRPMGVNEIAKCQGITPSAAYRILKTLEATGWSFQMSDGKYIPGEKLSYVTEKNNFHLALAEVAYPVMQELTVREILPMNLVVRQDRRFFILQQTRTNRYVDFVAPVRRCRCTRLRAGRSCFVSCRRCCARSFWTESRSSP